MDKEKNQLALLVEDDENWVKYFKETVAKDSRNCFEFHYADTLKLTLEKLTTQSYSLVLLDLLLPDSQGQDTISALINQVQYTPVVVLTTLADAKMQDFAFAKGIEDYLIKDEYDEKLFFHVSHSAINRCISRIQNEFYDDLSGILSNLKSAAKILDIILRSYLDKKNHVG